MRLLSYRTHWPWYTNVAPASWLVIRDVNVGRHHLDLSNWAQYDPDHEAHELAALCREVTKSDMPAWQYLLIHRNARLSPSEVTTLCQWTRDAAKRLHLPPATVHHRHS